MPTKTCVNDCSGKGICKYVSVDTGHSLNSCMTGDPRCYSTCNCSDGMFGMSCDQDSATFSTNQRLKYVLIKSLKAQTDAIDGNLNTVLGWSIIASSLAQEYDELTAASVNLLTKILKTVLEEVIALTVPYNQVQCIAM